MSTRATLLTGAIVAGSALTLTAGPATAASAAPATGTATIRSAHLSPDTPGVDVYLSSFSGGSTRLWVPNEAYGAVSKYAPIAAGLYTVSMRAHGAPASAPAMLSWTLDAKSGYAYTAAAVGTGSARKGTVLDDDLTPPKAGKARVRLIQAASVAPKATVVAVNGPVVAQDTRFATATGYAQVAAGTWPLKAASVSMPTVTASGSVSVPAGSVTSILLLDKRGGGLQLRTVLDSAAAIKAPKGPVPAGGGGMATTFTSSPTHRPWSEFSLIGLGVALLGAGAYLTGRRRARSAGSPLA